MTTPQAVAIYARISKDAEGEGKGVKRQIADCHKKAADLGWTVAGEYVDNDTSAYSGKPRPEYDRMMADIESGTIDGVLIYNIDRITRQPIEFEQFQKVAERIGIPLRCATGDADFGTEDGLFMGRMQAAFAAKESAAKSRRIKRKNDEKAAAGQPHGGSQRPFGFLPDKITHDPVEANAIRTMAARFLAGESLQSLAKWLEAEGIQTVNGGVWRTPVIKSALTSARNAGLRAHRGEIVGEAVWDAIITPEERQKILATFEARKVSGRRTPRRYLLSGLLRCSLCDGKLYTGARKAANGESRRYSCTSGPDHRGCGKIAVVADPAEEWIMEAVLYRLDTPELAAALAGQVHLDAHSAALADAISADEEQLDTLAVAHANHKITMREWLTARKVIDDRVTLNRRRLRRTSTTSQLADLAGQGDALRTQWSTLNLTRQVAIVAAVLDHASVLPGSPGATRFDPDRVHPMWRL